MSTSPSILVVRLSAIGDLVLVAPVVAQLHHEGYEVSLLCKDAYRSLALCLPGVAEVYSWEKDRVKIGAQGSNFHCSVRLARDRKIQAMDPGVEDEGADLREALFTSRVVARFRPKVCAGAGGGVDISRRRSLC